jgi:hypothetical protein
MVGRPCSCPSVRHAIAVLVLAASGSAGCQFNPSGQPGGDSGPGPTDPDARIVDARENDGRPEPDARQDDARPVDAAAPPDAPGLPPDGELVGHDVLTRYFIDEANSGSDESELRDAADDRMDLSIDYNGGGTFIENAGNRGLRWDNLGEDGAGRASVQVGSDTKIRQRLGGATRATIEVVVDIDQFVPGSRISHIGEADDRGVFTLRLEEAPARVRFVLNNNAQAHDWNVTLTNRDRTVLHLVLDTTRALAPDRVQLYVDGVAQPSLGLLIPGLNEAITIASDDNHYVLGNINDGGRGIAGTIFYAAMYTAALTPDEVDHNAEILLANDDTPAN